MEPFYPLHVLRVRAVPARAARRSTSRPPTSSPTTPTSPRTPTAGSRHASSYVDAISERLGLGPGQPGGRARQQRRLPAPALRRRGIPVLGIEPAANVAEVAEAKGVATRRGVLRAEMAEQLAREGTQADLVVGEQRAGPGARPQRLRRGHQRLCSADDGVVTIEFPHLLRLIAENQFDTIYHEHFSLLLVPDGRAHLRRPRPPALRRRGAAHATAARCGSTRCTPTPSASDDTARWRRCCARGARAPACDRLEYYDSFTRQVRGDQAEAARVPDRRCAAGKTVVGYGAPGKGNTLLNYCGIRERLPRLHRRPQPAQAGPVPARHPRPHLSRRRRSTRPARLRPHPAVEPEGRDHPAARPRARLGRQVHRSDPRGEASTKHR